jgi:hemoglobin
MEDIKTLDDIKLLVDTFYGKIQVDPMLGGIFNGVIKDRWPAHLEKMYRFWQTILLMEHTYSGSPFPPHAKLPVGQEHFATWLRLWHETVDKFFAGEKADEAKWRGDKMAEIFQIKIDYFRNSDAEPLM